VQVSRQEQESRSNKSGRLSIFAVASQERAILFDQGLKDRRWRRWYGKMCVSLLSRGDSFPRVSRFWRPSSSCGLIDYRDLRLSRLLYAVGARFSGFRTKPVRLIVGLQQVALERVIF
jgi:hypothetical protein